MVMLSHKEKSFAARKRLRNLVILTLVSLVYIFAPDELVQYAGRMLLAVQGDEPEFTNMLVVGSSWGEGASKKKQMTYYPALVATKLGMKNPSPTLVHIHNHHQHHRPPTKTTTTKQQQKRQHEDKNKMLMDAAHDAERSATINDNFRFPSLCIFSMIRRVTTVFPKKKGYDGYDVIVLEYPDDHHPDHKNFGTMALRLRHRFPRATMVFLNMWYPLTSSLNSNGDNDDETRRLARNNNNNNNSSTTTATDLVTAAKGPADADADADTESDAGGGEVWYPEELVLLAASVGATVCELPRPSAQDGRRMRSLKRLEAWQKYFHWDARHFSNSGHVAVSKILHDSIIQQRRAEQQQQREKLAATRNTTTTSSKGEIDGVVDDDCCNVWYTTGWTRNHQNNNNLVSSSRTMKMIQLRTSPRRYALETTMHYKKHDDRQPLLIRSSGRDKSRKAKKLSALEEAVAIMNANENHEKNKDNDEDYWIEVQNPLGVPAQIHLMYLKSSSSVAGSSSSSSTSSASRYPAVHVTLLQPNETEAVLPPNGILLDPNDDDDEMMGGGNDNSDDINSVVATHCIGTVAPGRVTVSLMPLQNRRRGFRVVGILVTPARLPTSTTSTVAVKRPETTQSNTTTTTTTMVVEA